MKSFTVVVAHDIIVSTKLRNTIMAARGLVMSETWFNLLTSVGFQIEKEALIATSSFH